MTLSRKQRLEIANTLLSAAQKLESTVVFLNEIEKLELVAPAAYFMGASSSPNFIIVTSVSPDSISYIEPADAMAGSKPKVRRVSRPIADSLIMKGGLTALTRLKSYQPKLVRQIEDAMKGKKPRNFKVKDYDYLRVQVTSANQNVSVSDLWSEAEKYGSVGGLGDDTLEVSGARNPIEGLKKDKKFAQYTVIQETKIL